MNILDVDKKMLDNMYKGDKKRDARDKIRGFLFQDLVAIDYLLDDNTECICTEFLEDVNVLSKDGTFNIIQVKYYPKTEPKREEIMTDLYYQYLRMQEFGTKLKLKVTVVIHRPKDVTPVTLGEMKKFVNVTRRKERKKISNISEWLNKNIYTIEKKQQQKQIFFTERASKKSMRDFCNNHEVIEEEKISVYMNKVGEKLYDHFQDEAEYDDDEHAKRILLGLAITYIQKRYMLEDVNFDCVKIVRNEFFDFVKDTIKIKSSQHIIGYVNSHVWEQYVNILEENPELEDSYIEILNQIVRNTQTWFSTILSTQEGQFQLINTVSLEAYDKVSDYNNLPDNKKITRIIKCSDGIQTFLFYLWKIMIDIYMDKINSGVEIHADMLKPETYMNPEVLDYICVKFPEDYVETGVILPTIRHGQEVRDQQNIFTRMDKSRPRKWYMSGKNCGKREYEYNVAVLDDENSVVDMESQSYIIECLDCIKIDKSMWSMLEKCKDCIFSEDCVKGRENK